MNRRRGVVVLNNRQSLAATRLSRSWNPLSVSMRFEQSTRNSSKAFAAILVFVFAGLSFWAGRTWQIDGVDFQIFSVALTTVALLLGCTVLFRIVFPYTFMLELNDDGLRFGKIWPIDSTIVLHHRELSRVIIDADEGHVWVVDSLGKTHLISGELSFSQKDFVDIKTLFERVIPRENVSFRPLVGTERYPVTSRIQE